MPTFDVMIGGRTYHVEVPDPGATPLQVVVDGQAFEVEIGSTGGWVAPQTTNVSVHAPPSPARRTPQSQTAQPGCTNGEEITAPMPGTILSVDVQQGQRVEGGQVVCVLEAMKMKNPIRTAHGGTVVQLAVQVGQNVTYGDLLAKLD
jgi:biotin carboxyl carrier protein